MNDVLGCHFPWPCATARSSSATRASMRDCLRQEMNTKRTNDPERAYASTRSRLSAHVLGAASTATTPSAVASNLRVSLRLACPRWIALGKRFDEP